MASSYNATAESHEYNSLELVEVDEQGRVIRAAGTLNFWSGTPEFDAIWRNGPFMGEGVTIHMDGGARYYERVRKMGLG